MYGRIIVGFIKMDGASPQALIELEPAVRTEGALWSARILSSIADLDRSDWDRLYGNCCRGFDYFRACELSGQDDFKLFAIAVFSGDHLIAGGPVFDTAIPLEMLLEGKAREIAAAAGRRWPKAMSVPIVGLGSPYWQEMGMAFDPSLDEAGHSRAMRLMLEELEAYAKRNKIATLIAKDVTDADRARLSDAFDAARYSPIQTLPMTTLAVPHSDDDYIHSLSANMRSNMRRKLKKAKGLRMEIRTNVDGIEDELHKMRSATIARAKMDFEAFSQLPRGYYRAVLEQMPGRSFIRLYWYEEKLIGFTLVLRTPREVTETYTGMLYPDGPDHGLFFLNWMVHIREARELGMTVIDSGPTTYITKERLNCRFHRTWLYVRDRKRLVNWFLRKIAPSIGFDKTDADLKQLGANAPYVG